MSKTNVSGAKVGYQWYPNDWKQSDTFLDVDDPLIRYYYREIIDLLYLCGNAWDENKTRFEKAQRVKISADVWAQVKALFEVLEKSPGQFLWSHKSVEKRIDRRSVTSAENGQSGGRPPGSGKPKNNLNSEPNQNLSKPKKPNGAIKEIEINRTEDPVKGLNSSVVRDNGGNPKPNPLPPLRAVGVLDGKPDPDIWRDYGQRAEKVTGDDSIGLAKMVNAFRFFWPSEIPVKDLHATSEKLTKAGREVVASVVFSLAGFLNVAAADKLVDARKFVDEEIKIYQQNENDDD